jgi:hypothetical protein
MNTYFNVTGKLRIKNILFSGVNSLVTTTFKGALDLSVLPQLYCTFPNEPNGILDPTVISAVAKTNTKIEKYIVTDKNQTKFTFSCPLNKTAEDAITKPPTKFE